MLRRLLGTRDRQDSSDATAGSVRRGRVARYVLLGYLFKALLLGILWLIVPEWPGWAGAKAQQIWLGLAGHGLRQERSASQPE